MERRCEFGVWNDFLESGQRTSREYGGASNWRRRSEGSGVSGEPHVLEQNGTVVVASDGVEGPISGLLAEEVNVLLNGIDEDERPSEGKMVLLGATWGGTLCSDDVDLSLDSDMGDLNTEKFQRSPGLRHALDDILLAEVLTVTCGVERGVMEAAVAVEGEDPLVELVHWQRKVEKLNYKLM